MAGVRAWLERWEAGTLAPGPWNRRFLPAYFGRFEPADFHADLGRDLHGLHLTRGTRRSYIAPRGGAKSTWCTLAYPLRAALEGWEPYTLILSDSSDQADQHLAHIRRELEDNALIRNVYRAEAGIGSEWKATRIGLRNGCIIESLGTGKKVRGRRNRSERPSLVVFDDIQSGSDVVSPVMREAAWRWTTRDVIPAGNERTNFIAVGSALHRDAVAVRIGQLAGWAGRTFRAVHSWPSQMAFWDEFARLATNLADDRREGTARAFYANNRVRMDAGAVTYWPDRWPLADLMLLRATVGAAAFETEYQGVPGTLEGAEWPTEYFDRPDFFFDDWPPDIVIRIQSLDPSKGATDKSDYQGHIMLALSRYGTMYADCELRREANWVERAIDIAAVWHPQELIAEANNTMGLFTPVAEQILHERRVQQRPVRVVYNERINTAPKLSRIRALTDYFRRGQLRVRNTAGGRMLVEQLRDIPHGEYDDGPDALATAVIRLQELVSG